MVNCVCGFLPKKEKSCSQRSLRPEPPGPARAPLFAGHGVRLRPSQRGRPGRGAGARGGGGGMHCGWCGLVKLLGSRGSVLPLKGDAAPSSEAACVGIRRACPSARSAAARAACHAGPPAGAGPPERPVRCEPAAPRVTRRPRKPRPGLPWPRPGLEAVEWGCWEGRADGPLHGGQCGQAWKGEGAACVRESWGAFRTWGEAGRDGPHGLRPAPVVLLCEVRRGPRVPFRGWLTTWPHSSHKARPGIRGHVTAARWGQARGRIGVL